MDRLKQRELRVAIVLESHVFALMGGAEYQSHLLADELAQRSGVSVNYIARNVKPNSETRYAISKIGNATGFRRRAVLFDAKSLWRALAAFEPDIIYQRMKQSYTALCSSYAQRAKIPMILHVASLPDVNGRLLKQRLSVNSPLDLLENLLGNWGLKHAAHIIAQTETQRNLLQKNFSVSRENIKIVRNFQPIPDRLPKKHHHGMRVLWVGNLKEVKQPEIFLSLAAEFSANEDIEFWMVGRPNNSRTFQSTMTQILNCPHIKYFGELPLERVNELMNHADVFVNTSASEGSPNTFIQAWSRGAIVTSLTVDVDGGMEARGIGYVAHGFERLKSVIHQLYERPALRELTADRAFLFVRSEHSLNNVQHLADFIIHTASQAA